MKIMREGIIRTVVFFVLIVILALSILGTWNVITLDVDGESNENINFPESRTGAGYVSINIHPNENGEENE